MKKIYFFLFLITLFGLSCSKSVVDTNERFGLEITTKKNEILERTKIEMARILKSSDYGKIDWTNIEFEYKNIDDYTLTSTINDNVFFIYNKVGSMKLYKIGDEVHAVY